MILTTNLLTANYTENSNEDILYFIHEDSSGDERVNDNDAAADNSDPTSTLPEVVCSYSVSSQFITVYYPHWWHGQYVNTLINWGWITKIKALAN